MGLTQFSCRLCDVTLICKVSKFLRKHCLSLPVITGDESWYKQDISASTVLLIEFLQALWIEENGTDLFLTRR